MRVLFLTHSYPRAEGDAPGSFILRLAKALAGEDVDVGVVAPAAPGLEPRETLGGIEVRRFHYAPRRLETLAYGGNMAEQVRASWQARFALVGFLGSEFRCAAAWSREERPDVVHAHWWFPNGLAATWVARLTHRPLVTTMHGTDVRLARSVAVARPGFRHVLRSSAAVTAVSRWLAGEANSIIATPRVQVAPMPVATELFSPAAPGERSPDRLLFVGRLTRQKGVDHLLRALALTRTRAQLDVVGDGDERERLLVLAEELGISDRVRWHGAMPQHRLAAFYRGAAALVVPSVEEGLGLVAVEAQLCDTPVIASDSGGLPDVVQHERTGLLVPAADPAALAAAIDVVLSSPAVAASLGGAGRLTALATFAPESVARRYADIYRNAIASSPK